MVYECCVANHMQGWPKFIARQWAISSSASSASSLAAVQYFASTASGIKVGDVAVVDANISTTYPFDSVISFSFDSTASVPLQLRIPAWCKDATVKLSCSSTPLPALSGTMHEITLPAGKSKVELVLPMPPRFEQTHAGDGSVVVMRGPIVYALQRTVRAHDATNIYDNGSGLLPYGQPHGQNNYILGAGEWRYALNGSSPAALTLVPRTQQPPAPPKGQGVFSPSLVPAPMIAVDAFVLNASSWGERVPDGEGTASYPCGKSTSMPDYQHVVPAAPPTSPIAANSCGRQTKLLLVPYGATDIRMASFPIV